MIVNDGFGRYMNPDQDWQIGVLGNLVSLRSIVVTKGFDLGFWFTVLFVQTMLKPDEVGLVSEIQIEWVST